MESINSEIVGHLSPITNWEAFTQSDSRSVGNCMGERSGRNLGFPKIGVSGDVSIVWEACKVACDHCRRVLPIRGCDFNSGGIDFQLHNALFRGIVD